MPEPTPEGYVRICMHRKRGRAHLARRAIDLTTLCSLPIPWHVGAPQNRGWAFDELNKRNICANCKKLVASPKLHR